VATLTLNARSETPAIKLMMRGVITWGIRPIPHPIAQAIGKAANPYHTQRFDRFSVVMPMSTSPINIKIPNPPNIPTSSSSDSDFLWGSQIRAMTVINVAIAPPAQVQNAIDGFGIQTR
jgi:hypothetical protein